MVLLEGTPRFGVSEAERIARELFGLRATAVPLPGERDQNFLLDGRLVLKIANAHETRALLEAQNAAMRHLTGRVDVCPSVVPAPDGREIVEAAGGYLCRLLTWIPGVPLGTVRRHSGALISSLGRTLGALDRALSDFDHPAIHRTFQWDLVTAAGTAREYLPLVRDAAWQAFLAKEIDRLEPWSATAIPNLRRSAVHNDANDYNVIVGGGEDAFTRNQTVVGLVDFGDMLHGCTIADPAIAIAYAVLDKPDPLSTAALLAGAYHRSYPLREEELSALLDLVILRLCLSACIAAHQQRSRPDDAYLAISQGPIVRTLPILTRLPRGFAEATFRHACGLEPSPHAARVRKWLEAREPVRRNLLEVPATTPAQVLVLDLSPGSPLVDLGADDTASGLERRVAGAMRSQGATVAIGRYGEPRLLYTAAAFGEHDSPAERRTVHLGLDLFAPAGTAVQAPIDGRVHVVTDNTAPLDYGPVAILRHETGEGDSYFTLYGHLSRRSIARLRVGQAIGAGEAFAALGDVRENGGWAPHLHFQVITDLMELGSGYPGVCRASELEVWRALSPDPDLVLRLRLPALARRLPGTPELLSGRRALVGSNVRLGYREPLRIVRGWMQHVYDENGRRYLDAYNNVPHVGHCHPRVVRAAAGQLRVLNTNTRYLHETLVEYAARLTATLPPPLRVCYFVNSGSEANELALRLSRAHTSRRDVIVLQAGYHGNTTSLIDISPYKFDGPGGQGRAPWVHVAMLPDPFRGPYRRQYADAGRRYAESVAGICDRLAATGGGPAAFIAETCPSVAGQIVFPSGYLQAAYEHVRRSGGVCIADEVQTAYGRMGTGFYAFEDQHVAPDIVVLGKPIGNGYPLGAVITTEAIAASFDNGMEFFSTFGGSTVSAVVGLAVLEVVHEERLQAHALSVGQRVLDGLHRIQQRHPVVGDVRGSGLFLGVELVSDRGTLEPAAAHADYVVNRLREQGVLIGTDGPFHNVLKIRPPMPFAEGDADRLCEALDGILAELPGVLPTP
jgi:4-aminobutyrate aminotransferase-like enzyme/Ser/Thr protein kinase RdoA (MazF antagonist)